MQSAQVRRAGTTDVLAIRELSRAAYAKWVPLIGREPWPMTADYGRAVAEHVIDLLEVNGELVALIELIPQSDHLLIENVAVQPEQQGKRTNVEPCRSCREIDEFQRSPPLHERGIRSQYRVLQQTWLRSV